MSAQANTSRQTSQPVSKATAGRKRRETFGRIDKRGRSYRARYLHLGELHTATTTFATVGSAREWLQEQRMDIANGRWLPPEVRAARDREESITLADYYPSWIASRTSARGLPLADRTKEDYKRLLRAPGEVRPGHPGGPLAVFLDRRIKDITVASVRKWWASQIETGKLTQASRSYGLLRAILNTAVEDQIIDSNPCAIKGASTVSTGVEVTPPTDTELEHILAVIDPRWRLFIIIEAIGGLRFGEVAELRRSDIEPVRNELGQVYAIYVHVSRAAIYTARTGWRVKDTKSAAGKRTVILLGQDALDIMDRCSEIEPDDLLFPSLSDPSKHVDYSGLWHRFDRARKLAGTPTTTMHALRHYAGTRYAQSGATIKETMAFLGHSSHTAAMRYQHAGNRSLELAQAMQRPSATKPDIKRPAVPKMKDTPKWVPQSQIPPVPSRVDGRGTAVVGKDGRASFRGLAWQISRPWAGREVQVAWRGDRYWFSATNGVVLIQHTRPAEKVRVVKADGKKLPLPHEVGLD